MIRVLMPRIYTSKHDGFVKNFVENGEPTILNRPFDSFARTAEDFIVPSKISTKLSPNILNGLQIVSMFTPIKDTIQMVCLCNEKGTITDVSESNSLTIPSSTAPFLVSLICDFFQASFSCEQSSLKSLT